MVVEQAIYGEAKNGHGLRAGSGDRALATLLAPRLDLPDNAPSGAEWSPFVSGFPYRDVFVFARTFSDANATRAGMVLSHALICPIEAVTSVSDLRPIFDLLLLEAVEPSEISSLKIEFPAAELPGSGELYATASALISRGGGPVVRVGHAGFETLVASLWARLWPSIRRDFSFRLSFGPGDLVETPKPALICTPSSLVARWQGHRLIEQFTGAPITPASDMLCSAGGPLRGFAETIGCELSSFEDLRLLEHAYRCAVLQPDAIGNTVAAIRLVDRLSPAATKGLIGKGTLLERLTLQLDGASVSDMLPLRNLHLGAFAGSDKIWGAMQTSIASNFFSADQDASFQELIEYAFRQDAASGDWRAAVLKGLSIAASGDARPFASAFWRWALADPKLTSPLLDHIGSSRALEDALILAVPTGIGVEVARPVLAFAARKGLYLLSGATAAAAYSPIEAARMQVALDPPTSIDGLRLTLSKATAAQKLGAAIEIDDAGMTQIAAELVAKNPGLLAGVNVSSSAPRRIWSEALRINRDAWNGPSNPQASFEAILMDFLDGDPNLSELIDRLAGAPLGNLLSFPRRAELWQRVSGDTRERLLQATASGWLAEIEARGLPDRPEPPLQAAILVHINLDALLNRLSKGQVGRAVEVVCSLSSFGESRFRSWLRAAIAHTSPLPLAAADAVGRLAVERRWNGLVDDLLKTLRAGRQDVRPALRACVSLVAYFDRWLLGLSEITRDEKWESLLNLTAELYPTGPDHDGLWERAGGKDADVSLGINGRSRWRDGLAQVRRGKGPGIEKLLREMRKDFVANKLLQFLAEDREFGGYR